jgi:hypothetical protein
MCGRRGLGREFALALVDPLHAAGQAGQQPHDGAAHMAGAVELQREARRRPGPGRRVSARPAACSAASPRRRSTGPAPGRAAMCCSATAAPASSRRARRWPSVPGGRRRWCPAPRRPPPACACRLRAAPSPAPQHLHHHGRPALASQAQRLCAQPSVIGGAACTACTARRMASGVAGAISGGSTRWPPAADTASRIAKNTENGSSSGGSPTALLRWMLSARWARSNSAWNTAGQSLAVGIL